MLSDNRLTHLHPKQIWVSPAGTRYRVRSSVRGGQAVLVTPPDAMTGGRRVKRDWDDVIGWVLEKDAPDPLYHATVRPMRRSGAFVVEVYRVGCENAIAAATIDTVERRACLGYRSSVITDRTVLLLPTTHSARSGRGWCACWLRPWQPWPTLSSVTLTRITVTGNLA